MSGMLEETRLTSGEITVVRLGPDTKFIYAGMKRESRFLPSKEIE